MEYLSLYEGEGVSDLMARFPDSLKQKSIAEGVETLSRSESGVHPSLGPEFALAVLRSGHLPELSAQTFTKMLVMVASRGSREQF